MDYFWRCFFSFALIFGKFGMPALGIAGAGWGTTISYWIMVFVLSTYLLANKQYQIYLKQVFKIDKPFYIWELLKVGLPMGVIFSVAQAVTVRMGHLIGANDIIAAKRTNYAGLSISITFMSFFAVIYWLWPSLLISVDFDVNDPENALIVSYTKQLFAVSAVFQLLEASRITLFGALPALKDTNFTLVSSIISFWGIALPR